MLLVNLVKTCNILVPSCMRVRQLGKFVLHYDSVYNVPLGMLIIAGSNLLHDDFLRLHACSDRLHDDSIACLLICSNLLQDDSITCLFVLTSCMMILLLACLF